MLDIFYMIAKATLSIIVGEIIYIFLAYFFEKKRKNAYVIPLSVICYSIVTFYLLMSIDDFYIKSYLIFLFTYLFAVSRFIGRKDIMLIAVTVVLFIVVFFESTGLYIVSAYMNIPINQILQNPTLHFTSSCISQYILLVCSGIAFSIKVEFGKNRQQFMLFFFELIGSIIAFGIAVMLIKHVDLPECKLYINILLFVIILVNELRYILFYILCNYYKEKLSNIQFDQKIKLLEQNYVNMEESVNSMKQFRHDVLNHSIVIKNMLDQGFYDEAKDYVNGIGDRVISIPKIYNTGNRILDAIVSAKSSKINQMNIDFQISFNVKNKMLISSVDLCTIVGNALDNAIEAQTKIKQNDRKITIDIREVRNQLMIQVVNAALYNPIVKGKLKTTKNDKINHGFGFSNITNTVKKNNGEMVANYDSNQFFLTIFIK